MDASTLKQAQALLNVKGKPGSLRTKAQKLRYDIQRGAVKYLHVSVLVGFDPIKQLFMRTPIGKGATAKAAVKNPNPIGRRRRAQQRFERAANEELARAAL